MGHSLGGKIIMYMLKEYPELLNRIKGVIIIDIAPKHSKLTVESYVHKNWENLK